MSPKQLLNIAIAAPLRQYFDYWAPEGVDTQLLRPGIRVRVPFGKQEKIGILLSISNETKIPLNKLKSALEIIDYEPIFSEDILKLCFWAADYYHCPLGEVFSAAMPALLRKGKPAVLSKKSLGQSAKQDDHQMPAPLTLNADQQQAVAAIQKNREVFQVFLLDGVTGSGKTEVYLQSMTQILQDQKQVLVLVPEIGLTPQTIQHFRERFNLAVVALHSGLTERERLDTWLQAKSGAAKIVIGTRSAIFTPFANLGLIIVDEEHDLSFKQQDGFRYHARDLAIMRAQSNCIPIVLGSATPSLESLHNVDQGRYQHLRLLERAGIAKLPEFEVIDIRKKQLDEGLSPELLETMRQHLSRGEQVMLFLNRRGFAPVLMCHACGWMVECKRCDTRMTYHQSPQRLHCHRCEAQRVMLKNCELCHEKELHPVGLGTERIEAAIEKHFPEVSIARIDRDSMQRKGALEALLKRVHSGENRILIGTQMLAKGHHFPNVTLVAIVDTDGGFFSSDFRALERMGQLILQVSGRAGREEKTGKVMIQTHHPHHPLLQILLKEGYALFAKNILQERQQTLLPPYSFSVLFRAEAHQLSRAMEFLQEIKNKSKNASGKMLISGPIPAPVARKAGYHRSQLFFQAEARSILQNFLKKILPEIEKIKSKQKVRWSVDVDPLEII